MITMSGLSENSRNESVDCSAVNTDFAKEFLREYHKKVDIFKA